MGLLYKTTTTTGLINPAASAETVIYTTPILQIGTGTPFVDIRGTVALTPGTSTVLVNLRVRQGATTAGASLALWALTVTAGNSILFPFGATDSSGYLQSGAIYSITIAQTSGSAAGTTNQVDIGVIVLWLLLGSWE